MYKYSPEIIDDCYKDMEFSYYYVEKWHFDRFKLFAENRKIVEYRVETLDV